MKKQLLKFLLTTLTSAIALAAFSQDNFHHVMLKGDIVKEALNDANFSYFDFSFMKSDTAYFLGGYKKDGNGNQLGDLIALQPLKTHKPKPFKNKEKRGHLYLTRNVMTSHYVDGSEDYILTPEKTKDPVTHKKIDFVSYRFSNKVCTTCAIFLPGNALIPFDLNPSPPYQ